MSIEFCASSGPSLGVEVELSLVDRETGALRNCAPDVLATLDARHGADGHPKAKPELFQSIVEIITGVCATVDEARRDLSSTLAEVSTAAEGLGAAVISSGTHPFSHWSSLEVTEDDRYQDLVSSLAWPARRLAICGVHFHVGVRSAEHAVRVVEALTTQLPLLLALSASSPYWHGMDTGLASCRTKIFEALPTAGLPPRLDDWADFESYLDTLVNAGVIKTVREVWWDIRPHPNFGTVELRMCDGMPTMREIAALAALAQSLVASISDRLEAGETSPVVRPWVVTENKWLAARHGLDTSFIVDDRGRRRDARELVAELTDELAPVADRLGCAKELGEVTTIAEDGPSYVRQRAVMADGGTHLDVVESLVRELAATSNPDSEHES
ncbi:MAG TPA: glutamate--cysteine ligase [Microthrixaceae bacterium]|nr:glutamate--cysteine ligase [Microthrixaceae bacterium]